MVRGAAGSVLTSWRMVSGSHSHLCGRVDGFCRLKKSAACLVSYRPLAHTRMMGWEKPKLQVPRRKLGPRRHGERDREAPRGAEDRRRARRQAPQGVDLELPL